jgi:type II secretory pathway component PulJ
LIRAENVAAGVRLVADRRATTMAELRRGLTRSELEEEIARAIVDLGRDIARSAFTNGSEEPEGNDLVSRVARAYFRQLEAAKLARDEEEADRALERRLDA